jgi:hypothetical protein
VDNLTEEYIERNRRSMSGMAIGQNRDPSNGHDGHGNPLPPYNLYGPMQVDGYPGKNNEIGGGVSSPDQRPPSISSGPRKFPKASEGGDVTIDHAADLFHSQISNPRDALHLLVRAVAGAEDMERRESLERKQTLQGERKQSGVLPKDPNGIDGSLTDSPVIDPALTSSSNASVLEPGMKEALRAWSHMKFVRAGWLTAREAIAYIDYFYSYLAPLTPISPPDFSNPASHPRLLKEEPMLTITLLTITSRYMTLSGPGRLSRADRIHDRLWHYLQGMITRMFWGQEQFGGGFCGAGKPKPAEIEAKKRGLRSMGTIER